MWQANIFLVLMWFDDAWIYLQVAPQLLSVKEKEEVSELVDTMIGFGISYKHQKPGIARAQYGVDAQSALVLDPPIDSLVKYTVVFGCTTFISPYFWWALYLIWFIPGVCLLKNLQNVILVQLRNGQFISPYSDESLFTLFSALVLWAVVSQRSISTRDDFFVIKHSCQSDLTTTYSSLSQRTFLGALTTFLLPRIIAQDIINFLALSARCWLMRFTSAPYLLITFMKNMS